MFEYPELEADQYAAEEIVNEKIINGKILYQVKWLGYPHSQNTWEPLEHLINVPQLISYWNQQKRKLLRLKKQKQKKFIQSQEEFNYKPVDTNHVHEVVPRQKPKRGRSKKQADKDASNQSILKNWSKASNNSNKNSSLSSFS